MSTAFIGFIIINIFVIFIILLFVRIHFCEKYLHYFWMYLQVTATNGSLLFKYSHWHPHRHRHRQSHHHLQHYPHRQLCDDYRNVPWPHHHLIFVLVIINKMNYPWKFFIFVAVVVVIYFTTLKSHTHLYARVVRCLKNETKKIWNSRKIYFGGFCF